MRPGKLRISRLDPTASSPTNVGGGTLLGIMLHQYAGCESSITFGESSKIGNIEAELMGTQSQSGRVVESLED